MSLLRLIVEFARGILISSAELIPGISGGTIALIIGVYERILDSAGALIRGVIHTVTDPLRGKGMAKAKDNFSHVDWKLILPLAVGMVTGLLIGARIIAPLVEQYPIQSRAMFFGLTLVALIVPARMVGGKWGSREWILAAIASVLAFFFTGIPGGSTSEPNLWFIPVAGALAVCALVIPGMSGSFVLLILGLYEPSLAALNERNIPYIAALVAGMIIGFALFVRILQWLLESHRRTTLAIMTGFMAGSLRALWPWQTDDRGLLAPSGDIPGVVFWFVVGMALIALMLIAEARLIRRKVVRGVDVFAGTDNELGDIPEASSTTDNIATTATKTSDK